MPDERLKGVYHAKDYADAVWEDFKHGIKRGEYCGWGTLDHFYTVKKGQCTIVSGIPSHGKSTWLDNVMVNLAKNAGWKFLICSPENQPINRHIESLIEIYIGKKFEVSGEKNKYSIAADEMAIGLKFVDEHFQFINPDETDFYIEYILALSQEIKDGFFKFDGLVIDPYNEMEQKRPAGFTETQYIADILGKYRRFARKNETHNWMIAHPKIVREVGGTVQASDIKKHKVYAMPSLYDISGGANWYNKADMGVIVYRDMTSKPEKTVISTQKVRFRECGKRGDAEFFYDFLNNRLVECSDELLFQGDF